MTNRLDFLNKIEMNDFVDGITTYFDEIMTLYDIAPKVDTQISMTNNTPVFNIVFNNTIDAQNFANNLTFKSIYEIYGRIFNILLNINDTTVIVSIIE